MLQHRRMSNTLTIRLPEELLDRLRKKARRIGLPVGRIVRQWLEAALSNDASADEGQSWRRYVGIIKGGRRDVSTRKGLSRK